MDGATVPRRHRTTGRTRRESTTTGFGGKDNFAADGGGRAGLQAYPQLRRRWQATASSWPCGAVLTGEAGIRQFLDVGTGIPAVTTPTRSPARGAGQPDRLRDNDVASRVVHHGAPDRSGCLKRTREQKRSEVPERCVNVPSS